MAYSNNFQNKKYPSISAFGGINTGVSPFNIGDSEASDMMNLGSGEYPAISPICKAKEIWTAAEKVYFMGTLFTGVPFIVAKIDGVVGIYYLEGKSFIRIGTESFGSGFSYLSATNFSDGKTILATGKKLISITADGIGYKVSDVESNEGSMPENIEYIATKDERLISASSKNDVLGASEYQTIQYVNADDFQLFYVRTEAERYAQALAIFGDVALYFKRKSTHILYGKNPDSYSFDTLSHTVGCVSPRSIAETDKGIIWLGEGGVYQYNASTLPYLISSPVQKYIDNMKGGAAAVSDGRKYYLSLPQQEGFVLLVYDTEFKVWHVQENPGYKYFLYYDGNVIGCDGVKFYCLFGGDVADMWHFITKPYDLGGVSGKVNLYRIYVNLNAREGSNVEVMVSGEAQGESFMPLIRKQYIKDTDEKLLINIPPNKKVKNMPYFRLKISGSGDIKVYGIEANLRVKGRTY